MKRDPTPSENVLTLLARAAIEDAIGAEAAGDWHRAAIEWLVARSFYASCNKGVLAAACELRAETNCRTAAETMIRGKLC